MKKRYYLFVIALLTALNTYTCPTCVGRMTADSPPFFSETDNTTQSKPTQEKKLSWREEIIKQQQQKVREGTNNEK